MGFGAFVAAVHLFCRHREANKFRDPEKAEPNGNANDIAAPVSEEDEQQGIEDDDATQDASDARSRFHRFYTWNTDSRSIFARTRTKTSTSTATQSWWSKAKSFIFPRNARPADIEQFAPNYRYSPIISGVIIPFSILLEIPGLTERWYVETEDNRIVNTRPNPSLLYAGMGISIACAVLANICLILRFSEKWIKPTTLLCILFLTVHDGINIATLTAFGVVRRKHDGYTYGQAFWMTLCSTMASTITNVNLIVDYVRIPNFSYSGSGLTRKQRSLVVLVIVLLMYIALGALINSQLLSLSYIDGLYFTTVSIETIGFGDIVPTSTGARVFMCFYIACGMIMLGIVIIVCRDTVLEGFEVGYRKRLRHIRVRKREAQRFRRRQARWRDAVEWRLRAQGAPVWVPDSQGWREQDGVRFVGLGGPMAVAGNRGWLMRFLRFLHLRDSPPDDQSLRTVHIRGHPFRKHLNIEALSDEELHAAALEAGVPLEMFVDFSPARRIAQSGRSFAGGCPAEAKTPTDAQLGRMTGMLTKVALAIAGRDIYVPMHPTADQHAAVNAIVQGQDAEEEVLRHQYDSDTLRHSGSGAIQDEKRLQDGSGARYVLPKWARRFGRDASTSSNSTLGKEKEDEQKSANMMKLVMAWSVFLLFWFVGAAIFSATESWTYGIALYFCFISFTTTGYGDYTPVTPAGRSIFVVWALFGVGALTILAAVIEDAGSSRYKAVMHSRVFDKAVQRYRKRTAREMAQVPHTEYQLQRIGESVPANGDASKSRSSRIEPDQETASRLEEAHAAAKRELESLPHEIIRQARTFHDYIQFFVGGGGHDDEDLSGEGSQMNVPRELKKLLDEIVEAEGVGNRLKEEILQDEDAKHTLFMLSIERALKRMIQSAERALVAIAERDSLLALQEEQLSKTATDTPVHQDSTTSSVAQQSAGMDQIVDDSKLDSKANSIDTIMSRSPSCLPIQDGRSQLSVVDESLGSDHSRPDFNDDQAVTT